MKSVNYIFLTDSLSFQFYGLEEIYFYLCVVGVFCVQNRAEKYILMVATQTKASDDSDESSV